MKRENNRIKSLIRFRGVDIPEEITRSSVNKTGPKFYYRGEETNLSTECCI
ncbi:hypothetical protein DSECCO2_641770 [anaerobic digester metagenome]|jgi:hypothetical protein